jgi:hypothetical protein
MSVTINGTPVYTAQGGPNPTAVPDGLVAGSGATVAVPGPSPVSAAQQVWGYFVSH